MIGSWTRLDGQPISKATKKQHLVGFKQFIKWYGKEFGNREYLELADRIEIKIKLVTKNADDLLTRDELDRLRDAAKEPRDRALISLLTESGCRAGELISCKIKNVTFTDNGCKLTFPKGKTGARTILLIDSTIDLRRWLAKHPLIENGEAPLFVTLRKRKPNKDKTGVARHIALTHDEVLRVVYKVTRNAGITKRVHPHLFRHTRATVLSQQLNEMQLRQYLGWTNASNMPAIYVHLSGHDLDNAILTMHGIVKKEDVGTKAQRCPRCKVVMPPKAKYCEVCGMSLDCDVQQTHDSAMKELATFINSDPQIIAKFMTMLQK